MKDIREHKRVIDTFTGPTEKRVLRWLALRMPPWMNPDILTIIGVVGSLIIFFGYWLCILHPAFLWLASFGFVVNWFGDSLDGTLARVRKIERPLYGFFIDHTVDAINEAMVFLGLGLSPFVRFELAALALIGYLMLSVLVYVRTCVKGEFVISYVGLGPTEARLIAILANCLIFFVGNPIVSIYRFSATVYDWIAIAVIILLFVIFLATLIKHARELAAQDRVDKRVP